MGYYANIMSPSLNHCQQVSEYGCMGGSAITPLLPIA